MVKKIQMSRLKPESDSEVESKSGTELMVKLKPSSDSDFLSKINNSS